MLQCIKKNISRFVQKILTRKFFQNSWLHLLHLCYYGMNLKNDGKVEGSGEFNVLKSIREYYNRINANSSIIIFDVGANKGLYAEAVLDTFDTESIKIYCFEPSENIFENLLYKFHDNPKIKLINVGLSNVVSESNLFRSKINSGTSSLHDFSFSHQYLGETFEEKIKLDTVDNFLEKNGITKVHFLKIDIEGHEYFALQGAVKSIIKESVDFIQFEFGSHCINSRVFFKDIYMFLSNQYKIYRILPSELFEIKQYSFDLEIFATTNYLAINKRISF